MTLRRGARLLFIGSIVLSGYAMLVMAALVVGLINLIFNMLRGILSLLVAVVRCALTKETYTCSAMSNAINTIRATVVNTAGDWCRNWDRKLSIFWKDHNQQ